MPGRVVAAWKSIVSPLGNWGSFVEKSMENWNPYRFSKFREFFENYGTFEKTVQNLENIKVSYHFGVQRGPGKIYDRSEPKKAFGQFLQFVSDVYSMPQGRSKGGRGKIVRPKPKKLLWCYFRRLYFSNNLPKIDRNSIFQMNFYQKISKCSQNFPTIWVFRPNARKFNAWFVKFFEKYAKIMDFSQFSYEFFENFRKFLRISQQFVFFAQTPDKMPHCLLNFVENYAKIMHYWLFS